MTDSSEDNVTPTVSPRSQRKQRLEFTKQWAAMTDQVATESNTDGLPDDLRSLAEESTRKMTESLYQDFGQQDSASCHGDVYLDDDVCSLVESSAWHENDLILAAELGKALLERNKELEKRCAYLHDLSNDQEQEIDLLLKQLQPLRDLNDNKMKMYEDMDKHYSELEKHNNQLKIKSEQDKIKIDTLKQTVQSLEARQEEFQQNQSDIHKSSPFTKDLSGKKLRKTNSFPTIPTIKDPILSDTRKLEKDYFDMLDKLNDYRFQISNLQMKNEVLEGNLDYQISENDLLQQQIDDLSKDMTEIRRKISDATPIMCSNCRLVTCQTYNQDEMFYPGLSNEFQPLEIETDTVEDSAAVIELMSPIETDTSDFQGTVACGQLQSGGQVYSSKEHLEKIGASTTIDGSKTLQEVSLLHELNDQYDRLVSEYENLIVTKKAKMAEPLIQPSTSSSTQFESRLSSIFSEETRLERKRLTAQNYKPKYKDLFRSALATLNDFKTQSGTT